MVNIGNRRIKDRGGSLEHLLDHASAVDPINRAYKHVVPKQNSLLYLLKHALDHIEQLNFNSRRIMVKLNDDVHEVGLGGSDNVDGLGLGERELLIGGEDWSKGGVVLEGGFGSEVDFSKP